MHPAALLALAFMMIGAVACFVRPAWVPPYFTALLYANIPDTLRAEYGLPSFFMFLAPALVGLALARQLLFAESIGRGWKQALWWLVAWGAVILASFLYATDRTRTAETLFDYLDALFIVLIMTLFVRRRDQLGPIVWSLVGAGAFLSLLTVHQGLTGNFGSTYGGFARGELRSLLSETEGMRSAGPLSTNYFALILVALVPLAAERLLHTRKLLARASAGLAFVLIVTAIGFTYSRGGFATLGAIAVLALFTAPRIPRIAFVAAPVALAAGIALLPATYLDRMSTFGQIWHGIRGQHVEDSAIRGRISEVRSALMMVGDHPLIGVGAGNYEVHYPNYARVVALDGRREERAAHSLYLEVAAENGLIGFAVFGGMLGFALLGIQRAREAFVVSHETELWRLVTALGLAFAGFLIGSVFLHLSYPRFLWVFVGLALAIRGLTLAPASPVPVPISRLLRSSYAGGPVEERPCA
jgi:putative inorganic carbon (HCO3(-)) transporter